MGYRGSRGKAPTIPYEGDKLQHFLLVALSHLDAGCSHDQWFRIGAALHSATDGSHDALEAFDCWSSRGGSKYPGRRKIEYQWQAYARGPGSIQLPTLIYYLQQEGVSWRELTADFERTYGHRFDD